MLAIDARIRRKIIVDQLAKLKRELDAGADDGEDEDGEDED